MATGAVARRNRTLKIYGLVLLVGIVALVVYCATRPGFDLSTPEKALDTFKRAMDDHRWSQAEKCLTDRCREHYAQHLADRTIFDFYSPDGYRISPDYRMIPRWRRQEIVVTGPRARAHIVTKVFVIGGNQAGFWLQLKKGDDGLWRVDGPRVNIQSFYDRYIPDEAKGWGRRVERK